MISCRELWQIGCFIRNQYYEGLQKLHLSVDKRCVELSYILFSRQTCFYRFQKMNGRFWAQYTVRQTEAEQSIPDVALFFSIHYSVISQLGKQFFMRQTVVQRPVAGHLKVAILGCLKKLIYCWLQKIEILLLQPSGIEEPLHVWHL